MFLHRKLMSRKKSHGYINSKYNLFQMSSRHEDEQREKEARSRRPLKDGEWACTDSKCARVNAEHRNTCEMCGKPKPRSKNRVGKEIGKEMADKSKGLFAAEDWVCSKCGNVNWARRKTCNVCNAPKLADLERRTGYGGGYNDRQDVEYVKRDYDDEFDEFGRKKKRKSEGTNFRKEDEIKKNEEDEEEEQVVEEEASEESAGDLDKYKLGSEEEEEENDEDLDKYDLTADPEIAERKIEIIRHPPPVQNIESDCSCSCSGGECSCEDSECEQKDRKERERISKSSKQRDREQNERDRSRKRSRSRDKDRKRSRSKERRRSRSKERERIKSRSRDRKRSRSRSRDRKRDRKRSRSRSRDRDRRR